VFHLDIKTQTHLYCYDLWKQTFSRTWFLTTCYYHILHLNGVVISHAVISPYKIRCVTGAWSLNSVADLSMFHWWNSFNILLFNAYIACLIYFDSCTHVYPHVIISVEIGCLHFDYSVKLNVAKSTLGCRRLNCLDLIVTLVVNFAK
jgi:hypothetical protein